MGLEAAYEATLWAAVANMRIGDKCGRNIVVLSFVGGGVFGNKMDWIVDAINRAISNVSSLAPAGGWGLEIRIAHFKEINPVLEEAIQLGVASGSLGAGG